MILNVVQCGGCIVNILVIFENRRKTPLKNFIFMAIFWRFLLLLHTTDLEYELRLKVHYAYKQAKKGREFPKTACSAGK